MEGDDGGHGVTHVEGDKYINEVGTWGRIEQNESGTNNKQHISHATGEQRGDTHIPKWG